MISYPKTVKKIELIDCNDEISNTGFDWKYKFDPEEMVDSNNPDCIYKKVFKLNIYNKDEVEEYWYLSMEHITDCEENSLYYKDVFGPHVTIDGRIGYKSSYSSSQIIKIIESIKFGEA